METKEIIGLAFLAFTLVFALGTMWRFKRMADSRKETDARFAALKEKMDNRLKEIEEEKARAKLRQHPNYSHARFDPTNPDVLLPTKREVARKYATPTQTQTVGNNSVGIQSQGSTTVVHDSSSDLLTTVALWSLMNNSRASSVSGTYEEDTGRVTVTTREEPEPKREESSYSSSYSSSSSDDDDRKSSYSSSYSSSSSDSSYSSSYDSSSSDSSYSSSSSD